MAYLIKHFCLLIAVLCISNIAFANIDPWDRPPPYTQQDCENDCGDGLQVCLQGIEHLQNHCDGLPAGQEKDRCNKELEDWANYCVAQYDACMENCKEIFKEPEPEPEPVPEPIPDPCSDDPNCQPSGDSSSSSGGVIEPTPDPNTDSSSSSSSSGEPTPANNPPPASSSSSSSGEGQSILVP